MSLTDRQIERYSRQIIVAGGLAQERLLAARVAIIGAARDAESLIYYLVGAGVGYLYLELRGEVSKIDRIVTHARALNSDAAIALSASPSAEAIELTLILADGIERETLIERLADRSRGATIVASLARGRVIFLTETPQCLPCLSENLLAPSAAPDDNDQYIASFIAMELLKMFISDCSRQSYLTEFDGYATRIASTESLSPESCSHLFRGLEPRVWLFDFDNTLVALEREVDWAASRVELEVFLRNSGIGERIFAEIPKGNLPLYEPLRANLLEGSGDAAVGGLARSAPREVLVGASGMIEAYELRGVERARALHGATALLRRLHGQNRAVAVVTSNSSRAVRRWLEREQLTDCVKVIIGRDAMLPLKPASDSLFEALRQCAATAADAVFVGDSRADFEAARAARIRFIEIRWKPGDDRYPLAADGAACFSSPAALLEALAPLRNLMTQ